MTLYHIDRADIPVKTTSFQPLAAALMHFCSNSLKMMRHMDAKVHSLIKHGACIMPPNYKHIRVYELTLKSVRAQKCCGWAPEVLPKKSLRLTFAYCPKNIRGSTFLDHFLMANNVNCHQSQARGFWHFHLIHFWAGNEEKLVKFSIF